MYTFARLRRAPTGFSSNAPFWGSLSIYINNPAKPKVQAKFFSFSSTNTAPFNIMGYATTNPFTNKVVKEYPTNTKEQVEAAVAKAHDAFLQWRLAPVEERVKPFAKAAEILRAKKDYYADLLTLEMGKLKAEADEEVLLSADILDYYVKNAPKFVSPDPIPVDNAEAKGDFKLIYQGLGIIVAVQPWNFPLYQPIRALAPVLAGGNAMLLKHAKNVPAAAQAVHDLMLEAGLPNGVFTTLFPTYDQVDSLLADDRVKGITLTGSERGGLHIAELAGKNLKKCTLELGGSDPFVVLDDVDVAKAAAWAVKGRLFNGGQCCVNSKRFVVHDKVYDQFLEHFRAELNKLVPGDPSDPKTTLPPLSSQGACDELHSQIKEAVDHGAKKEVVTFDIPNQGAFLQPVILTNLAESNPARKTEFFGPVAMVIRVKDEAEAIQVANETPFGLGASVVSNDVARAERVAGLIDAGMVAINRPVIPHADVPFGGIKRSGLGRELGDLGLKEFVNIKIVNVTKLTAP